MGLELPLGVSAFHFTFLVVDHASGAFSSAGATPSRFTPRQAGQSAANRGALHASRETANNKARRHRRVMVVSFASDTRGSWELFRRSLCVRALRHSGLTRRDEGTKKRKPGVSHDVADDSSLQARPGPPWHERRLL